MILNKLFFERKMILLLIFCIFFTCPPTFSVTCPPCTPPDQCHTVGTCNPITGICSNPAKSNGTSCNDGNLCTPIDTCQNGTCVAGPSVTCTALDQCHTVGTCTNGICSNPAKTNGSTCSDGNACTQADTCQAGACTGANPITCTASVQCHDAGTCDPVSGLCSNPTTTDGTACDDGNACTQADTCQSGTCIGSIPPPISPLDAALAYQPSCSCPMPADIKVKLDTGIEESIFDRGATVETISGCLYLSPLPVEPDDIVRHVGVFDLNGDCAQCPSYVSDLIYKYYDGDLSAGSNLCSLPPDQLKNCVVLESRDEIFYWGDKNNLDKKPHAKNGERSNAHLKNLNENKESSNSGRLKNMKSQIMGPFVWEMLIDIVNRATYDAQGYISLTNAEINKLLKRWPQANTRYYAATRQHWFSYASPFLPESIIIDYTEPDPANPGMLRTVRVHYVNRADILALMISPAQALTDFKDAVTNNTCFYPDLTNANNRRTAGSLNYEFRATDGMGNAISNTRYRSYYHANFIDPFPLFLFAKLIDFTNNLSNAFDDVRAGWSGYRWRAFNLPIQANPPPPPLQEPNRSWWDVPPIPPPAPQVNRFAIVIQGASRGVEEDFFINNTIAYIQNVFTNMTNLNYPAGNFAIYNVSGDTLLDVAAFQTKINATVNAARTIRTNTPNARIELVVYFEGHGRSINPEPLITGESISNAWFKDGGLIHEFWLGGTNSLLESTLKDFANGYGKSNDNPNVNNRIFDRIDFIDNSCESGAGVY